MKQTLNTLLLWITFSSYVHAQYYSRIIPFPFGNPTLAQTSMIHDVLYIPVIYPGEQSTLIEVNQEIHYHHLNYFDFALQATMDNGQDLFLYAKDRSQGKAIKVAKWNGRDTLEWIYEHDTDGEYNVPYTSSFLNGHIYIGYDMDFDNGNHREIGIAKIDPQGNLVWAKKYQENDKLNGSWDFDISKDSSLLMSSRAVYYNIYGGFPQLSKLDQQGNLLWQTTSTEKVAHGATPVWIAQLSNGNIVQAYGLDLISSPNDSFNYDWNPLPIRLKWYNAVGDSLKQKLIFHENYFDQSNFSQIEAGRGDYFFAYGRYSDNEKNEYYGLLTKFNNDGDTIWSRIYRHADFDEAYIVHNISGLEELENGDLILTGTIYPQREQGKIWILKTDSLGCIDPQNCHNRIIADNSETPTEKTDPFFYPNPSKGIFQLRHHAYIDKIEVYDFYGRLILQQYNPISIDLKPYSKNKAFFARIYTSNGQMIQEKLQLH